MATPTPSQDPFDVVRADMTTQLQEIQEKAGRLHKLAASDPDMRTLAREVEADCVSMVAQLGMLKDAMDTAAVDPARFNLTLEEIEGRRQWLEAATQEVNGVKEVTVNWHAVQCTRGDEQQDESSATAVSPRFGCLKMQSLSLARDALDRPFDDLYLLSRSGQHHVVATPLLLPASDDVEHADAGWPIMGETTTFSSTSSFLVASTGVAGSLVLARAINDDVSLVEGYVLESLPRPEGADAAAPPRLHLSCTWRVATPPARSSPQDRRARYRQINRPCALVALSPHQALLGTPGNLHAAVAGQDNAKVKGGALGRQLKKLFQSREACEKAARQDPEPQHSRAPRTQQRRRQAADLMRPCQSSSLSSLVSLHSAWKAFDAFGYHPLSPVLAAVDDIMAPKYVFLYDTRATTVQHKDRAAAASTCGGGFTLFPTPWSSKEEEAPAPASCPPPEPSSSSAGEGSNQDAAALAAPPLCRFAYLGMVMLPDMVNSQAQSCAMRSDGAIAVLSSYGHRGGSGHTVELYALDLASVTLRPLLRQQPAAAGAGSGAGADDSEPAWLNMMLHESYIRNCWGNGRSPPTWESVLGQVLNPTGDDEGEVKWMKWSSVHWLGPPGAEVLVVLDATRGLFAFDVAAIAQALGFADATVPLGRCREDWLSRDVLLEQAGRMGLLAFPGCCSLSVLKEVDRGADGRQLYVLAEGGGGERVVHRVGLAKAGADASTSGKEQPGRAVVGSAGASSQAAGAVEWDPTGRFHNSRAACLSCGKVVVLGSWSVPAAAAV